MVRLSVMLSKVNILSQLTISKCLKMSNPLKILTARKTEKFIHLTSRSIRLVNNRRMVLHGLESIFLVSTDNVK